MPGRTADDAIRVMVSAPSAVRRAALESIARNSGTTKLVGGIYGLDSLTKSVRQFQPDVLLIDLDHPDSRLLVRESEDDEDEVEDDEGDDDDDDLDDEDDTDDTDDTDDGGGWDE